MSSRPDDPVVGYDHRVDYRHEAFVMPGWDDERRAQYLLNQRILAPLSADYSVWPVSWRDGEVPDDAYITMIDDGRHAWPANLAQLSALMHSLGIGGVFVAVTLAVDRAAVGEPTLIRAVGVVPESLPPGAQFLGYDVVDAGGTSGLMNCSLVSPPRVDEPFRRFIPLLNPHHLFRGAEAALAFATDLDHVVSEHAPFSVVGLWILPDDAVGRWCMNPTASSPDCR